MITQVAASRRANAPAHMAGLAIMALAPGMLACAVVEAAVGADDTGALVGSGVIAATVGVVLWRRTRVPDRISIPTAFSAVAWTWIGLSVVGALPYVLAGTFPHWDDAIFEAVSGYTGTGSTVLVPIETTGRGLLMYRQLTQWYGGMGLVVLAVAVLPHLGVGGLELLRSESPGPSTDRLAPRVQGTATRLWAIYVGLTAAIVAGLLVVGLSPYDAVAHALSAVSTGGFSPYDASVGHFDSLAVELVLVGGMFLAGVNFALHWRAVRGEPTVYWRRSEFRFYVAVVVIAIGLATLANALDGRAVASSLRGAVFEVVSLITCTGFGTDDIARWAPAAELVALFLMMAGGMAGSTSGGMKLLRVQVMGKVTWREILTARRPHIVRPIRLGTESISETIVRSIVAYVLVYVLIGTVAFAVLGALGADPVTSVGAVASAMGGVGPGLGEAGASFLAFTRPARMLLAALMLIGRLEVYSLIIGVAATVLALGHRGRPTRWASR